MTAPSISIWQRIELTLKDLSTGVTETHNFTNRPVIESTLSTIYWPILENISDIGTIASNWIPGSIASTFQIENTIGSFGYQRKFSDKLQRKTAIDQTCNIYISFDSLTLGAPSSWILLFSGRIKSIDTQMNEPGRSLVFRVESNPIKNSIPSVQISSAIYANPPSASIGKNIPLVFGNSVQVAPLIFSHPDDGSPPYWTYGLGLKSSGGGPDFLMGSIVDIYVKGPNRWVAIDQPASAATIVLQNASGATTGTVPAAGPIGGVEYAFELPYQNGLTNYILTGGYITLKGNGIAVVPSGQWTISIYEKKYHKPVEKAVASTSVDKANYSADLQAAAEFDMFFDFPDPVILDSKNSYYIVISGTNETGSSGTIIPRKTAGSSEGYFKRTVSATAGGTSWELVSSTGRSYFGFYGVIFTPSYDILGSQYPGLVAHNLEGFAYNIPPFANDPIDLGGIEIVVETQGITDSSAGVITGIASAVIRRAHFVARLLDYQYNTSTQNWEASGAYDISAYNDTHSAAFGGLGGIYDRAINGRLDGRQTMSQLLTDIMRNSAARLGLLSTGKMGTWAWGKQSDPVAFIPQNDIQILSHSIGGIDNVVNHISGHYDRDLTSITLQKNAGSGENFNDYSGAIDWHYLSNNPTAIALAAQSYALFGNRELGENTFNYIGDSASMEAVARYFMSVNALPEEMIALGVPLQKYYSIENLKIITFQTAELPYYPGAYMTSKDAISYTGAAVDPNRGLYMPRAEVYRAQVEGRTIRFNRDKAPLLVLLVRLINNPLDTT